MRPETNKDKTFGAVLWLAILTDVAIIGAIVTKVYRSGISGLLAWFQQFHFVSVSATGDRATYKLEPDYRFTAFYIAVILGALVLTVLLLRIYLRTRRIN
jgi:hypothetical protein